MKERYLEVKPLFEPPGYYKDPTGINTFGNLANDVKKNKSDIILTTEYVDSESINTGTGTITFQKLQNNYDFTIISYGGSNTGVSGLYIKGVIDWSDGLQSSFSTINNITIVNRVITLTVNIYTDRTPKKARLRISQLQ